MVGLILLASAPTFGMVLAAVAMVGMGSAVFHPESSRVARMASGGQHGLAQSLFQVGGNAGSSMGPLLAAFIVLPAGQHSIAWFSAAALLAIVVLMRVGTWYKQHPSMTPKSRAMRATETQSAAPYHCVGDGDSDRADLFQVLLPGEPDQLLHVLPDRQISRLGADGAGAPLRVSGRGGGGDHHGRSGGRSHRAQVCDLVVDSGSAAVHAGLAIRELCSGRKF